MGREQPSSIVIVVVVVLLLYSNLSILKIICALRIDKDECASVNTFLFSVLFLFAAAVVANNNSKHLLSECDLDYGLIDTLMTTMTTTATRKMHWECVNLWQCRPNRYSKPTFFFSHFEIDEREKSRAQHKPLKVYFLLPLPNRPFFTNRNKINSQKLMSCRHRKLYWFYTFYGNQSVHPSLHFLHAWQHVSKWRRWKRWWW